MRKKDEMEQKIANKSLKITWFITVIALFIIGFIQSLMNNGGRNLFSLIAILSVVLLITLERYYLSKINEDKSFIKYLVATLILVIIFLGIGFML